MWVLSVPLLSQLQHSNRPEGLAGLGAGARPGGHRAETAATAQVVAAHLPEIPTHPQ